MKVRVYGFEWFMGKGISLDEFCAYLKNTPSESKEQNRMITISEHNGYWVGLLLTIKNVKAFCKITNEAGSFVITPQMLEEGARMTDFNFFIINPNTGRGLYQFYHQSAATTTFSAFCKNRYDAMKNSLMTEQINQCGGDGISDKEKRRITKQFEGSLTFSTFMKKETFEYYIKSLKNISSFSFQFSTIDVEEKRFSPVSAYAKRLSHTAYFGKNFVENVKNGIIETLNKGLKRARVKGIDTDGNEAIYKLNNDFDSFAEYDFDEIIKTININSEDIVNSVCCSYIIQELLRLANINEINAIISVKSK